MKKIIAAFAMLLIVGWGTALAAIPDSSGVITGCYGKQGALRLINTEAGQFCANNETRIQWNQEGPIGATGPQGEAGPAGSQETVRRDSTFQVTTDRIQTQVLGQQMCEPSEVVVGGGFAIRDSNGPEFAVSNFFVMTDRPVTIGGLDGWEIGVVFNFLPRPMNVHVYAICTS